MCIRPRLSVAASRALRRAGLVVASLLIVSSVPFATVAAIAGGHLNVPWHLPAAAAIVCEPAAAGGALLLTAALRRGAPGLAAAVDGALPCARPARRGRARPGRMHEEADVADSVLWGVAAALWGASLCGPAFVALFGGDYLHRGVWGAAAGALALAQAAGLLRVLTGTGLFDHADALARAKKDDDDDAAGREAHELGGRAAPPPPPPPVSGTRVLQRVLAVHAAGGLAVTLLYWALAPAKVTDVWPALLVMWAS